MAYEIPGQLVTFPAGEDLSAKQYRWVKLNSDAEVIACATAGEYAIGIVQNNPKENVAATVMLDGISKVTVAVSETLAAGNFVGTSADGRATNVTQGVTGADTGYHVLGYCVEGAASTAGTELATVLISKLGPTVA